MIDPLTLTTAVSAASAAYGQVKRLVQAGREFEEITESLGKWMGAVSDIKKAEEMNQKPPLFKKLFQAGSVEEEALQIFMAKKKAEDMREDLRNIISMTRGPSAWQELLKTERDIRVKRQQMIYAQEERRRQILEWCAIGLLVITVVGFVIGMAYLYALNKGTI